MSSRISTSCFERTLQTRSCRARDARNMLVPAPQRALTQVNEWQRHGSASRRPINRANERSGANSHARIATGHRCAPPPSDDDAPETALPDGLDANATRSRNRRIQANESPSHRCRVLPIQRDAGLPRLALNVCVVKDSADHDDGDGGLESHLSQDGVEHQTSLYLHAMICRQSPHHRVNVPTQR